MGCQIFRELNDLVDHMRVSLLCALLQAVCHELGVPRNVDPAIGIVWVAVQDAADLVSDHVQRLYPTSKLILKVRTITRTDTGRVVEVVNAERAAARGIYFDGHTGPFKVLVAGLDKSALRAYPVPSEAVTLNLSVFRLPLKPVTDAGDEALEIDEQHHLALLIWAKHKAYGKQDAETLDQRKADAFEQKFYTYCAAARTEQERARRVVGAVAYGGI
jgi:hypothetical protein